MKHKWFSVDVAIKAEKGPTLRKPYKVNCDIPDPIVAHLLTLVPTCSDKKVRSKSFLRQYIYIAREHGIQAATPKRKPGDSNKRIDVRLERALQKLKEERL